MLSSCALSRTLARRFRQRVVPVREDLVIDLSPSCCWFEYARWHESFEPG